MKLWWKNFCWNGPNRIRGFSLLEVLFAVATFTIFISYYVISQGQNLDDSRRLQEDLILRQLAEDVVNQIILATPKLSPSATLTPETKNFEDDEYQDYEYTVEYRKIEIPVLQNINPQGEEETEDATRNAAVQDRIFKEIKSNIERILWQVAVTVKNRNTESSYTISTWIRNPKQKIRISL